VPRFAMTSGRRSSATWRNNSPMQFNCQWSQASAQKRSDKLIGIGGVVAHSPPPHHRTCGPHPAVPFGWDKQPRSAFEAECRETSCWSCSVPRKGIRRPATDG
jgi:hypothetical protein